MQMFSQPIHNTSLQEKQVAFCNWIFGTLILFNIYKECCNKNLTCEIELSNFYTEFNTSNL